MIWKNASYNVYLSCFKRENVQLALTRNFYGSKTLRSIIKGPALVFDQNFYGRGRGGGWGGVAVKDAWSGVVGWGVIKGSLQKYLKTGSG